MTHPVPTPDNPIPSRPGPCIVPVKTCCEPARGGDECTCAADAAELAAAFHPRDLRRGYLGPITFRFTAGAYEVTA